jgi:hypothetical protein
MYQVWSSESNTQNIDRKVSYIKAKEWVDHFESTNKYLEENQKTLYTPTTIMEIGNHKYTFVIYKAKLNRKGHVVFKVSTEEIKLSNGTSKKTIQLPCGKYDGVRFDIDYNKLFCIACLAGGIFVGGACAALCAGPIFG